MALRDYIPAIKTIATAINPVAGGVVSLVDTFIKKPTKKVITVINGKKTYIGIVVTTLGVLMKYLGYDVPVEATEGLVTSLTDIIIALGVAKTSIGLVHKIDKATK